MPSQTSDQRKLELVVESGLLLAQNLDLQTVVQAATDAGLELCGAQFGAFFYNIVDEKGESYSLYTLSGVNPEKFSRFPMPRNTAVFGPTFEGAKIVRSADITADVRYGQNPPYRGMPKGHLPVRSYLAVPVKAKSGEVLGGLFYGHEQQDVFSEKAEKYVAMVAAQAAVAIENVRLREQLSRKIVDLQNSETRQREAAQRIAALAAIVENSEDPILSKDLEGRITSWNDAAVRTFGFSKDDIIGRSIYEIVPPEEHENERIVLEKISRGEQIEHYETGRLTANGRVIAVDLGISPVNDSSGRVVGAASIMRDLTKRKQIEKALLQAEKFAAASRMAATIAHEVNNPLESVLNLLFLIETNAPNPAKVRDYARDAQSELLRAAHITKQTLGFYREHAAAAPMTVAELLADAVRIYQSRCDSAGIRIVLNLSSTRRIVLRKGEIMQVISNLLTNAIHAMAAGGTLTVSAEDVVQEGKAGALILIRDTGTGISENIRPHLFQPFFTTKGTVGNGIGLFVAKQFVEGHGGSIQFQSSTDSANSGTEFLIFLPADTPYAKRLEATSEHVHASSDMNVDAMLG